ncbi:hypothetical protein BGX26_000651, partial [Mortierella sp. AD094]
HEINNDMLVAMTLAASPSVPSPTAIVTSNGDPANNNSNAFPMTSLGLTRSGTSIDYHDPSALWSQLGITASNNINDSNGSSGSSFVSFPMLPFSSNGLSPRGQVLDVNGTQLNNQFEATSPSSGSSQAQPQQQSPPAASYPPTPTLASHASFAATVDEMALNPMGAHEQFTAILYSWSHQLGDPANAVIPNNPGSTIATCANTTYSPSSSTSSPALSTSSSFTTSSAFTASPSLAPSTYSPSLLSSSFSKSNTSSPSNKSCKNSMNNNNNNNNNNNSNNNNLTHNFMPHSASKLTRRLLQAPPLKLISASSSSTALIPGSMFRQVSTRSWPSPSVLPLTCQVCRKQYANNSTLRRHLKIHAYANNSARALAMYRSSNSAANANANANVNAITNACDGVNKALGHQTPATHRPSLCSGVSFMSIADQQRTDGSVSIAPVSTTALSTTTTSASASSSISSLMTQGYDPSSDPYIKKPECVGCNKAFARRDTVILHIKNQKRKWDLLNAILPTLTGIAPSTDLPADSMNAIGTASITTTTATTLAAAAAAAAAAASAAVATGITTSTTAVVAKSKRSQRQRRSHPYRMVEKLWHSTLQRKGVFLSPGSISKNGKGQVSVKKEADEVNYNRHGTTGANANTGSSEDDNDEAGDTCKAEEEDSSDDANDDDGSWPDMEAISKMDSQTKLKLMMDTMVLPPCWRERKVRIYQSFGVAEEKVLQ